MNRYKSSTPRLASGMAAIAMVVITMGVLVVLPAKFDALSANPYVLAAARGATMVTTGSAIVPPHTDRPEVDNVEQHFLADRAVPGTQGLREKRHKSSSRNRTNT